MKTTELLNGKKATTRVTPTCFAALLFFFCADLQAQVTIGGLTEPQKGAILDLNSNVKGGLVLSNVTITDPEKIPHDTNVFQGITADQNNQELRGAMVYNDGKDPAVPAGIYIWNGSCWTKNGGEVIINPPAITVDGAAVSSAEFTEGNAVAFALAVASPQPDVKYEWYKPATSTTTGGTLEHTGETYSTPTTLPTGPHYYYCKATSLSCPSVNAVSGVITVTVKPDPVNLPTLLTSNGILTGTTCFDVAAVNDGGGCGTLSSRQPGRSFSGLPEQVYTFTGSATGLSFDYKNSDAAHPVIESLIQSGTTVTVTFNTGLDTWARELTRTQALKAELYAIQNNQATKLTLSVSDCQCCPGLLVPGGEYNQYKDNPTTSLPDGTNNSSTTGTAANALLSNNSSHLSKTGYDLCYYKRDATSGSAGSSSGYQWSIGTTNVMNVCQTTEGVDDDDDPSSGWRLPHLAELAQIGQLVSDNGTGTFDSGVGSQMHVNTAISQGTGYSAGFAFPVGSNTTTGTYNLSHNNWYWSSTEYDGSIVWSWDFSPSVRSAYGNDKTASGYVRCVRPF